MNRAIRSLGLGVLAAALSARSALPQGQYSVAQAQELLKTKDWNRVLAYGQAWTRAEPSNPDAWFLVGRTYGSKYYHIGLEQPANAAPALERAAALKPDWPDGWHALGIIQQELGQWDRSAASLEHSVQLAPDRTKYWDFLCASYIHLKKFDQGTRAVENIEKRARTQDDWFMVGTDYYALAPYTQPAAYYQKSSAAFHRALELDPRNGAAWTNLGTTEQALGNNQAALEDYQKGAHLSDPGGSRNYEELTKDIQACMQRRQAIATEPYVTLLNVVSYNQSCSGITGEIEIRYGFLP